MPAEWVVLDLEATGPDAEYDRIVQIGIYRHPQGEKKTALVNPGVPIPPEATEVHRITDENVRDKPQFSAYAKSLHEQITGVTIVTYNGTRFDLPLLQRELHMVGIEWKPDRHIDVMRLVHHFHPKDLGAMSKLYLGLEGDEELHDAGEDAYVTGCLLMAMADKHGFSPDPEALEGHDAFVEKADQWVDSGRKFRWRFNRPAFAFGEHKGRLLESVVSDSGRARGFVEWMLKKDFPEDTKELCRKALAGEVLPMRPHAKEEVEA